MKEVHDNNIRKIIWILALWKFGIRYVLTALLGYLSYYKKGKGVLAGLVFMLLWNMVGIWGAIFNVCVTLIYEYIFKKEQCDRILECIELNKYIESYKPKITKKYTDTMEKIEKSELYSKVQRTYKPIKTMLKKYKVSTYVTKIDEGIGLIFNKIWEIIKTTPYVGKTLKLLFDINELKTEEIPNQHKNIQKKIGEQIIKDNDEKLKELEELMKMMPPMPPITRLSHTGTRMCRNQTGRQERALPGEDVKQLGDMMKMLGSLNKMMGDISTMTTSTMPTIVPTTTLSTIPTIVPTTTATSVSVSTTESTILSPKEPTATSVSASTTSSPEEASVTNFSSSDEEDDKEEQ